MNMRLLLTVLLLIAGIAGYSQSYAMRSLTDLSDQYTTINSGKNFDRESADIEGSPYLNEDFVSGEVILNDSIYYTGIPLRYNMYSDRIEFKNNAGQVLEVDLTAYSAVFNFGQYHFISTEYLERGKPKLGILEVLSEGRVQLYKQYDVHFKPATEVKGYQDAQPNRFVRQNDEYLYAIDRGKPASIRNTKALMEILTPFYPEIEEFKKSEKLKLKKEADLIRLIEFCNKR